MIGIVNPHNSVFFNLATEEYLLNNLPQGFVMVWKSSAAVVVGKHQNALAEVNLEYVLSNQIPVARRISGGGTVVHDPGNLNFTIALPVNNSEKLIDYKRFLNPIIDFLKFYGINATFSGRNDLLVNDLKISGNAQHHFRKNKLIMHHGTLLFDADLANLSEAIRVDPNKYKDKAVQSNRSSVCNLLPLLNKQCSIEDFEQNLQQFLFSYFHCSEVRNLFESETSLIKQLISSKFDTPEWNWGYSPAYSFSNQFVYEHTQVEVFFQVGRDAMIQNVQWNCSNPILLNRFNLLGMQLLQSPHFPGSIQSKLREVFPDPSRFHPLLFAFF